MTWEGWVAHTLLLQVEDEALPEEVEPFIAERVPTSMRSSVWPL